MIESLYQQVTPEVIAAAQKVALLVCDIDGVFSDGRIYLGNAGEELKAFHTKDGFGVKALVTSGVKVAVITGRISTIVQQRMSALKVEFIIQGQEHKQPTLIRLLNELSLQPEQIAYIGDDVPDLACIKLAGLGVAVQDAHPLVKQQANYITQTRGGFGAVRELCDIIMYSQQSLFSASGASL